jgi:myo-inositol-1(or 4)-monophosphatase
MNDAVAERHAAAEEIARAAGRLALDFFSRRDELVVEAKANAQDIVSRADREVEELIRARVTERFPDDGFLGEELGATPGASGYTWVIDPIDGTSPFLFGLPHWCVSIAVQSPGVTVAGAIAAPTRDEVFTARLHRGHPGFERAGDRLCCALGRTRGQRRRFHHVCDARRGDGPRHQYRRRDAGAAQRLGGAAADADR